MTISGYNYPTFLQKQAAHKERAVHIQEQLYTNCDIPTLTELFESIATAQVEAVMDVVSNAVVCDVDTIDTEYPE